MRRSYGGWAALCLLLVETGCVDTGVFRTTHGRTVLRAFESTVDDATRTLDQGVVLVKIKGGKKTQSNTVSLSNMMFMMGGGGAGKPVNGLMLTSAGHVLVPSIVKPDETDRIEVWIGDHEYKATLMKANDSLGMSIIKIATEEAFSPIDLDRYADLQTGAWGGVLEATDEDKDFQKLKSMTFCRGVVEDFYRQFMVDTMIGTEGALVMDAQGRIAGLVQGGKVLAMSDLCEDIKELLSEAMEAKEVTDESKKKAWLGLVLDPVNKEYALSKNIPRSSLWVVRALAESPAAAAGVQTGDLLVELNGKPLRLKGERALAYFNKALKPNEGKPFALTVLRNGVRKQLNGTFTKKPEDETLRAQDIGLTVKKIMDSDYFANNLATQEGVLVTEVDKGSPAATSGSFRKSLLNRNDVIVEMAGKPTRTLEEFSKVLEAVRSEKPKVLLVKFRRGMAAGYAGLNLNNKSKGETL